MRKITQIIELFAQLLQLITRMSGHMIVSASAKSERPNQIPTEWRWIEHIAWNGGDKCQVYGCVCVCACVAITYVFVCVFLNVHSLVCEIQCENANEPFKRRWHFTIIPHTHTHAAMCVCVSFAYSYVWNFCFARIRTHMHLSHYPTRASYCCMPVAMQALKAN